MKPLTLPFVTETSLATKPVTAWLNHASTSNVSARYGLLLTVVAKLLSVATPLAEQTMLRVFEAVLEPAVPVQAPAGTFTVTVPAAVAVTVNV